MNLNSIAGFTRCSVINNMHYCHNGMIQNHFRAGISHYYPDILSHLFVVAMNCTFRTNWLIIAEWASPEPCAGIFMQFGTIIAKGFFLVIEPAIKLYHFSTVIRSLVSLD